MTNFVSLGNKSIYGKIKECVLYDMDESRDKWIDCVVLGVLSYDGHRPTLKVLIKETGAIFDYVPFHLFCCVKPHEEKIEDLTPFLCDGNTLSGYDIGQYFVTSHWQYNSFNAFYTLEKQMVQAEYILSLDWPDGNQAGTLAILKKNCLAIIPNHKALFSHITKLPDYKKLKQEWK